MKVIKIYTDSQLVLLRNINPLLGKYRIPREIIKRMDVLLDVGEIGSDGFLLLVFSPVRDDIREIEDAVNAYPLNMDFDEELDWEGVIKEKRCKMARNREWFVSRVHIQETGSQVFVLYSIPIKHSHKRY